MTTVTLTIDAAKELGRALRFVRKARDLSLRDVMQGAGVSYQYLQNIERGERTAVNVEVFHKLGHVYDLPERTVADLILKARVLSALEAHGVTREHASAIWVALESHLNTLRYPVRTDLAEIVAAALSSAG